MSTLSARIFNLLPASVGQLAIMTGATRDEVAEALEHLLRSCRAYEREVKDLGGKQIWCPRWRVEDGYGSTSINPPSATLADKRHEEARTRGNATQRRPIPSTGASARQRAISWREAASR